MIARTKGEMKMRKSKSSWEYEKERNSKQIRIVFNLDDTTDALIYHFLNTFKPNRTSLIKKLVYDEMVRCAYGEK